MAVRDVEMTVCDVEVTVCDVEVTVCDVEVTVCDVEVTVCDNDDAFTLDDLPIELLVMIARQLREYTPITFPFALVCRAFRTALELARLPVMHSLTAVAQSHEAQQNVYGPDLRLTSADVDRLWRTLCQARPRLWPPMLDGLREILRLDRLNKCAPSRHDDSTPAQILTSSFNKLAQTIHLARLNYWTFIDNMGNEDRAYQSAGMLMYNAIRYQQDSICDFRGKYSLTSSQWIAAFEIAVVVDDWTAVEWIRTRRSAFGCPVHVSTLAWSYLIARPNVYSEITMLLQKPKLLHISMINREDLVAAIRSLWQRAEWPTIRLIQYEIRFSNSHHRWDSYTARDLGVDAEAAPLDLYNWVTLGEY